MIKCTCYEVKTNYNKYIYDLALVIANDLLNMGYEVMYVDEAEVFSTKKAFDSKGETLQSVISYRFNSYNRIKVFSDIPANELNNYLSDRSKIIILDSAPYTGTFDIEFSVMSGINTDEKYAVYYKGNSVICEGEYYLEIINTSVLRNEELELEGIIIYGIKD